MPTLDDLSCPACHRIFNTEVSKNRHIRQSQKCAWYRSGKLAEWSDPIEVLAELEHVADIDIDDRNLFELIPPPNLALQPPQDVAIGEAGPGPSTQAQHMAQARVLDDDEDDYHIEEYIGAGARVRLDDKLHDLWRRRFGERVLQTTEGEAETDSEELYFPFVSRLDWKIAHWVIKEDIGHNALNRLLAIPEVRSFYRLQTYPLG